MDKKKRTELTLEKKVELIREHEKTKKSCRVLSNEFKVGRQTVSNLLKRKAEVLEAYEENVANDRKRVKLCVTVNEELNIKVWEWYQKVRARNLPISGPMIQEQALEYAKDFSLHDFKASNGWLESFKKRHNIGLNCLVGESADVGDLN